MKMGLPPRHSDVRCRTPEEHQPDALDDDFLSFKVVWDKGKGEIRVLSETCAVPVRNRHGLTAVV